MNNLKKNTNNVTVEQILEMYGDIRTVYREKNGFSISDLYLNGDGEVRLECTDTITSDELAEVFTKNNSYTTCIHPLFKSRADILLDKCNALIEIESWVSTWVYEPQDNSFQEHVSYMLENIDFSSLEIHDYHMGVMKFLDSSENEFHFIAQSRDNNNLRIKELLLKHGDLKYLKRDSNNMIFISNLFIDGEGQLALEVSDGLDAKLFERSFSRALYNHIGDETEFLTILYQLKPQEIRKVKIDALKDAEDILRSTKYSSIESKFFEFTDNLLTTLDIKSLDLLDAYEGTIDFIESTKIDAFFIVKF